jgi:hypothetical protein
VGQAQFHADNHFVPSVYLRHFLNDSGKIAIYRTLVSHPRVPHWKDCSAEAVAYIRHLYTRIAAGGETDEIETWLDREFEQPVAEALDRAVSNQKLSPGHWTHLIRFAAAQMIRTPAFFIRNLEAWRKDVPAILDSVLTDLKRDLKAAKERGEAMPPLKPHSFAEYLPVRILSQKNEQEKTVALRLEAAAGRGLWQFAMRHILTCTLHQLSHQRWSIVRPYHGFT